jgi:cell division protein FtsZ
MDEIFQITEFVQKEAGEEANLIWGNCFDERLGEKLSVTIIATGFDAKEKRSPLGSATTNSSSGKSNGQPERQVVHLDDEVKKLQPSLFTITAERDYAPVEEKAANTVEFEFDNIRETVEQFRKTPPPTDPVRPELPPEERRRRYEEAQRRREEARNRPLNVVKLNSPQTIIELENQPAYLRRSIRLDDVPDAEGSGMSDWTISLDDETEIKIGGNPFLHDNVD